MTYYQINDLLNYRQQMALKVCGIFDEEEVNKIEPISYINQSNGNVFVTVWLFGNKKIYSAVIERVRVN